ncbi:amino acid permease, partial [Mycobacterium tuberculosis]|nr:amino acid permease [Mycobacterium tuberculosis]
SSSPSSPAATAESSSSSPAPRAPPPTARRPRQTSTRARLFALSRAGYLPKWLSLTGKRKTPVLALIVPGTIGFLIAVLSGGNGGVLLNVAVFGATVSYVLLNLSHIRLRFKEPDLPRGYRTPGGVVSTGIALVLASVAVVA